MPDKQWIPCTYLSSSQSFPRGTRPTHIRLVGEIPIRANRRKMIDLRDKHGRVYVRIAKVKKNDLKNGMRVVTFSMGIGRELTVKWKKEDEVYVHACD